MNCTAKPLYNWNHCILDILLEDIELLHMSLDVRHCLLAAINEPRFLNTQFNVWILKEFGARSVLEMLLSDNRPGHLVVCDNSNKINTG